MNLVLKQALKYQNGVFVSVSGSGNGDGISLSLAGGDGTRFCTVSEPCLILPGFSDVHVHFREPGFSYKETIRTGSLAAAHGGYTAVCTMPNLNPVPDTLSHLQEQLDIICRDACIRVLPFGSITEREEGRVLSEMDAMAPFVAGFSDDGRGVEDPDLMRRAMKLAKSLGKPISAHCEDRSLVRGGYIHDGTYARAHGHVGISSESEWRPIKRDLELAAQTGCAYHVCHISTAESVSLIREAKRAGIDVSCETAPHYLLLSDRDLKEDGSFKMNPPLRSERDREALLEGLLDGTIDMIATDHAPHSAEEKSRGLRDSLMGVVGLETAFPVLYTGLVKGGILSLERLVELMAIRPRERFGIPLGDEYTVWEVGQAYTVDPAEFLSAGRATPFAGETLYGKPLLTVYGGKEVYLSGHLCEADRN